MTAAAGGIEDDYGMDFRQLELRAVFGLPGVLPPEGVFQLAGKLEGVKAACYIAGDRLVFQSAPDGVSMDAMPAAFSNLARMTRDLGIADARTLTVQTDRGMLGVFP